MPSGHRQLPPTLSGPKNCTAHSNWPVSHSMVTSWWADSEANLAAETPASSGISCGCLTVALQGASKHYLNICTKQTSSRSFKVPDPSAGEISIMIHRSSLQQDHRVPSWRCDLGRPSSGRVKPSASAGTRCQPAVIFVGSAADLSFAVCERQHEES